MIQRGLGIALSLALLFTVSNARADKAAADEKYADGLKRKETGNFREACPLFAESYQLDPTPGTLLTLADCEENLGRIATAMAHYAEYLRIAPSSQIKPIKFARERSEALTNVVPTLEINLVPNAPKDTVVTRDGETLDFASLGIAIPVDPGEHIITARAPGGELKEIRVTLERGGKALQELDPPLPGPKPPPPPPVLPSDIDVRKAQFRKIAFVAGGIGVAGLATWGVMGALSIQKKSVFDNACAKNDCEPNNWYQGRTLAHVATVGLGLGITGFAVGTAMLIMSKGRADKRSAKPEAQVFIESGRDGTVFGLKGAF